MTPIAGQPILTAADMRAAEERAVAGGTSVTELMARAGAGVAAAARRLAAGSPVLIACGPGNNGGDGYVAARLLKANGVDVRIAASGAPNSEAAIAARAGWDGAVGALDDAAAAPVLVDALFGAGLSRELDAALDASLARMQRAARLTIAVDVPSGLETDTGALLRSHAIAADVTLALGAVKPAHVLDPAADLCGAVRLVDIGVDLAGATMVVNGRPLLPPPDATSTKYSRGMVAVIAGAMPGAAALASEAALRSGAGYVLMLADAPPAGLPHAVVCRPWSPEALDDARIGAVLVGPGLGRDAAARAKLDAALASSHALVIDGDALHLIEGRSLTRRGGGDIRPHPAPQTDVRPVVLTPHAGEFAAMFGSWSGSKIEATRAAAAQSGAIVVFKGASSVIAAPGGGGTVAPGGSPWLSTAGTGDVLAGTIAAQLAQAQAAIPRDPGVGAQSPRRHVSAGEAHGAAAAGVWLHGEAARRLGGAFVADDLARALSAVRAS